MAGAPPDKFTDLGQLWGNPLYDWPALRRRRYRWWVERLRRTRELFDVSRIDHFRGFVAYWSVPERRRRRARRPLAPRPRPGPVRGGPAPARRAAADRGEPRQDHRRRRAAAPRTRPAGHGGDPVRLRPRRAGQPPPTAQPHGGRRRLHRHPRPRHDPRLVGVARRRLARAEVEAALARAGIEDDEPWWALIRLAYASPGVLAMVQMQDVLGLGSEARMNVPGLVDERNWSWRLRAGRADPRAGGAAGARPPRRPAGCPPRQTEARWLPNRRTRA